MAAMSELDQALNQAIEQYRRSHPASERMLNGSEIKEEWAAR